QGAVWIWVMFRIGDDAPRGGAASASITGGTGTGTGAATVADTSTVAAPTGTTAPTAPIWRSTTALFLMFFFGLQSMNAYVQMGWLPQIYRDGGTPASTASLALALVGALNVVG